MTYRSSNVFKYNEAFTMRCYACGKLLGNGPLSSDHIIPRVLFDQEKRMRPTIKIHSVCNSIDKSKDDRWFSKVLMYRCYDNSIARQKLNDFIGSADKVRIKSIDVTPKDKSNYRLLKTILDGWYEVPQKQFANSKRITMRPTKQAVAREEAYIAMMAKGLLVRNSWFSEITTGEVQIFQFNSLKQSRLYSSFVRDKQNLLIGDLDKCIYQHWGDDISYVISPQLRIVYFEFYGQVGYSVEFDISFPQLSAKESLSNKKIGEAQKFLLKRLGLWTTQ